MATEVLRPTADGNQNSWIPSAGDRYECVDEVVLDTGDYVSIDSDFLHQNFEMEDTAVTGITNLRQEGTFKKDAVDVQAINWVVRITAYNYGSLSYLDVDWATEYDDWATNPEDSESWEAADVNAMKSGFRSSSAIVDFVHCAQTFVTVTYEADGAVKELLVGAGGMDGGFLGGSLNPMTG